MGSVLDRNASVSWHLQRAIYSILIMQGLCQLSVERTPSVVELFFFGSWVEGIHLLAQKMYTEIAQKAFLGLTAIL